MTDYKAIDLRTALLEELAHTPAGYLQTAAALAISVRRSVIPQPTSGEIVGALIRLENDGLLTRVDNPLHGPRFAITDAGRAALKS